MTFITRSGSEFRLNGKRFRFIGMNYYPFIVNNTSQASIRALFDAARERGITVFRTWCFLERFAKLEYPLGTNLLSNPSFETNTTGWTLGSGWSRVTTDAHQGSASVRQVNGSGYAELTSSSISVSPSTDYVYTFWRKVDVVSGSAPVLFIKGVDTNTTIKDAGYSSDTDGEWVRKQVVFNSGANNSIQIRHVNWNGNVTGFYDDLNLSLKGAATLVANQPAFDQLDLLLAEAARRDIELVLALVDNPTYDSKLAFVNWANEINGAGLSTAFPYIGFFTSTHCKQMYKDLFASLANHVNEITGVALKNDPRIAWWEMGNELRLDRSDPSGVNTLASANLELLSNPDGWADEMSTYMKSVDSNHLVTFGAMSHTWQWASGDTVSNGTYYGVDYDLMTQLPNIDLGDFHMYPTQGGGELQLLKYGQRLGFPNAVNGPGFRAQIRDYVTTVKDNGVPVVCGEIGLIKEVQPSTTHFPLYPRHAFFKEWFREFFGAGGDGVFLWSAVVNDGGSYSIVMNGWDEDYDNENSDDRPLMSLIAQWNARFAGKRARISEIDRITP